MKRLAAATLAALACGLWATPTASARTEPAVREMTCVAEDGTTTTFTGQQVRQGATPNMWRSLSGTDPAGFNLHGVTIVDPDTGAVVQSFGNTQGVDRNLDLVTCSFIISTGPLAGLLVNFEGFFVPATSGQ